MPFSNRIVITDENHRKEVIGRQAKLINNNASGKIINTTETHCTLDVEGEIMTVPWKQISTIY